jgi:hypothetical protein
LDEGETAMEWNAMLLLGAYHGINPGMGWLFAVALGMQAGNARGVWRALPPIALGHALAVGVILAAAWLAQLLIPLATLKIIVACCLASLGAYRLWRHRHPRFGGMRVGARDLTMWSFLMASAHGAGFMLLPFVMATPADVLASAVQAGAHAGHMGHVHHIAAAASASTAGISLAATAAMALAIHTLAYLATTAVAAQVVYRKLGLALLRSAWFNMDWLWAGALLVTGLVVLFV